MLNLIDLLQLSGCQLTNYKIHCAIDSGGSGPLLAFFSGTWKQWQEGQNKKNFECAEILSLIQLEGSRWLFAGVFKVLGVKAGAAHNPTGFQYDTQEVPGLAHLTGRAIVQFDKKFRASYLRGDRWQGDLAVIEIRSERLTIGEFPGFNAVRLSLAQLRVIVLQSHPSWRAALGSVSGVYVITDTSTGKHYIGSAYGGIGIWQRWTSYVHCGHGDNVELQCLLQSNGPAHADKFQFALVEVCDINSSQEYVIAREGHWKSVLCTRQFGLNRN